MSYTFCIQKIPFFIFNYEGIFSLKTIVYNFFCYISNHILLHLFLFYQFLCQAQSNCIFFITYANFLLYFHFAHHVSPYFISSLLHSTTKIAYEIDFISHSLRSHSIMTSYILGWRMSGQKSQTLPLYFSNHTKIFFKPSTSKNFLLWPLLVVICERRPTRNCNKCYQQQWQKQQNRNGKKVCVWKKRKNICYGISSLFNNCIVLHNFYSSSRFIQFSVHIFHYRIQMYMHELLNRKKIYVLWKLHYLSIALHYFAYENAFKCEKAFISLAHTFMSFVCISDHFWEINELYFCRITRWNGFSIIESLNVV